MLAQTLGSAGTFLVVKSVLGDPSRPGALSGLELMTLRFAGAGAILAVMLAGVPGWRAAVAARGRALLWLGFLAVPLNVGLFFEGAARAPAAHAALFYALTPIFVFVLERAAGRARATAAKLAGLGLALAGALTVLAGRGALTGPEPLGDAMLLGAAASWGLYTVGSRPLVAELGSRATMVLTLLTGTLLWIPIGVPIAWRVPYARLTLADWTAVAYTAVVTTVVCYSLWLFALKRLEPTQVAVFTNLQPVATVALAWLLLGEPVSVSVAIAAALILAGVSLVQLSPAVARRAASVNGESRP
jgi:drug/metabolite transporter (DMT)-like permease